MISIMTTSDPIMAPAIIPALFVEGAKNKYINRCKYTDYMLDILIYKRTWIALRFFSENKEIHHDDDNDDECQASDDAPCDNTGVARWTWNVTWLIHLILLKEKPCNTWSIITLVSSSQNKFYWSKFHLQFVIIKLRILMPKIRKLIFISVFFFRQSNKCTFQLGLWMTLFS